MNETAPHDVAARQLRFVDVGSAGGLQAKWTPHLDSITPILFEPSPDQAAELRRQYPKAVVQEIGLSNRNETRPLFITRNPYCVSLLRPNAALLAPYAIRPHFDLTGEATIRCARYDTLFAQGEVPQPDAVKIDVQGFEHEVLSGFGGLLDGCLGIELEAHFYPLYLGQKLLSDIVAMLRDHDFVLRSLTPVPHFEGDIVEVDAIFTRPRAHVRSLPPEVAWKYALLRSVWGLADQ